MGKPTNKLSKRANKKKSGSQPAKGPKITAVKSRKDKRKQDRKLKKQTKLHFYKNRFDKITSEETNDIDDEDTSDDIKAKQKADEQKATEIKKKKKEAEAKLKNARRKKELRRANEEEEKNIKKLEKQLKLNKRKGKDKEVRLPSSFASEGLDYLLDVCDSTKMDNFVLSEDDNTDDEDSQEEYFDEIEDRVEHSNTENELQDSESDEEEEIFENSDGEDEHEVNGNKSNMETFHRENENGQDEENYSDPSTNREGEDKFWEDIYGRTRDASGNVVKKHDNISCKAVTYDQDTSSRNKYVPPAMRAKLGTDNERKLGLQRQIKGLLNRLAESNMHMICRQMEDFYSSNSRNDMNECLCQLITSSIITNSGLATTPER